MRSLPAKVYPKIDNRHGRQQATTDGSEELLRRHLLRPLPDDGHQVSDHRAGRHARGGDLNNLIFSPSLFATAERLGQLHNLIASALEQLQGKNELFWLHAALDDAEVMNFQTKDVEFINQMQEWFPDSPWLNCSARSIANAISTERNKWLQEGERVKVTNLRASRQQFVKMMQNSHKIDRFIHIAYDGLYKGVMKLKAEFQK